MLRMVRRLALVVALVWLGWSVGRAQTTAPDFELMIDAPSSVSIRCVRGCTLWAGSLAELALLLAPGEPPPNGLSFSCGGGYVIEGQVPKDPCKPRSIMGWVKR